MSEADIKKEHVSVAIAGHVDSGKSTTTGRLLFELGGIPEREMDKLRAEAESIGKGSFAFAFYMDRQKDERERGVTISVTTKEFFTDSKHYTILDCPGHKDFIKNMITGSSQADVAVLMVPADGNFTTSIAKGDHKANEIQGQTRQHALLLNLLGVKQLIVCVNKMDSDVAKYGEERFLECKNEALDMLQKVGWKKDVLKNTPVIPISGWKGDNLIKKSENMPWWAGKDVKVGDTTVHVDTLVDALDKMVQIPARCDDKLMRTPISGVFKIKGVGDVLTGRIEQGVVEPGREVVFLPTHTVSAPCQGKIFSVEMHHRSVPKAGTGDNVGLNVKGLNKTHMPRKGDIMIYKNDATLGCAKSFVAQIQVLNHPGELKVGYCPVGFVRTGSSPCRLSAINWKKGKSTGGQKVESPISIKTGEMAEVVFVPQLPFVLSPFDDCEGLGRVAFIEGNSPVMIGKAITVEFK